MNKLFKINVYRLSFCSKIKCIPISFNPLKINYAYYLVFVKYRGLISIHVPWNDSKHGVLKHTVAILLLATMSVSYIQGHRNQIIHQCFQKYILLVTYLL